MEKVSGKHVSYELSPDTNSNIVRKNAAIEPFDAPVPIEVLYSPPSTTKSNGTEREILWHVLEVSQQVPALSNTTRVALARESAWEMNSNNSNNSNETVTPTMDANTVSSTQSSEKEKVKVEKTVVLLESLTPRKVHDRTGFRDIVQLLQQAAICYGGDLEEMTKCVSKFDWLKELLLYYEFMYYCTATRVSDYSQKYLINERTMMKVVKYRLAKVLECRERWPMYVSHE